MSHRTILFLLSLALLLCLAACVPASRVPIDTVYFERAEAVQQRTLVVFLPGRGSDARSFDVEGLVGALHRKSPGVDMVGVEAHLGYYMDRTLPKRLKEDVIEPARKRGYREIWLVGISMGGLGAILYDTAYPGDVTGLCLLAPYLGEGSLLEQISRAGGLANWQPGPGDANQEREIWQRLKSYAAQENNVGRVYLGFGTSDRFAATNRFFGNLLPAGQVVTAEGGHDWPTWRVLWDQTLERSPLGAPGPRADLVR
jgi:pimeloyl-ACP methyl ester carboxylesterase